MVKVFSKRQEMWDGGDLLIVSSIMVELVQHKDVDRSGLGRGGRVNETGAVVESMRSPACDHTRRSP